jgi:prepilin-type N-terminal cleavage/methylation domain-containing protein
MKKKESGFTLIELLLVIGIILVLSAIVIAAINPGAQLQRARNKQREAHVSSLYGAVNEFRAREGDFPACVSLESTEISNCEEDLIPKYFSRLPVDPSESCEHNTGYFIKKNNREMIGVMSACAELEEEITVGIWE